MLKQYDFETIDSTNSFARRLIEQGEKDNALITAKEQTAGRGRRGRTFYSPMQTGLYMTVIMPALPMEGFAITCRAAVKVWQAVCAILGIRLGIKWVNDLELSGKKVCGILAERVEDRFVIGIGINLNTESFPEEIRERAGSLRHEGISEDTRVLLANRIAEGLFALCDETPDAEAKQEDLRIYRENLVLTGKTVDCTPIGITGTVLGIDGDGGLLVQTETGIEIIRSGEVSVRIKDNI